MYQEYLYKGNTERSCKQNQTGILGVLHFCISVEHSMKVVYQMGFFQTNGQTWRWA